MIIMQTMARVRRPMKSEPTQSVQAALVLVDFQNEWSDVNAEDYLGNLSKLVERTNMLIDKCRSKK